MLPKSPLPTELDRHSKPLNLKSLTTQLRLIWASFLFSQGAMLFILTYAELGNVPKQAAENLFIPFLCIAIVIALVVLALRKRFLLVAPEPNYLSPSHGMATSRTTSSGIIEATSLEKEPHKRISRKLVIFIAALALSETITIIGFVLGFLTLNVVLFIPFALCSIALLVLLFPRPRTW